MTGARTTLRGKGQVTLPREIREALGVAEGDELEFEVAEPGVVVIRGMKMVAASQAWFWTPEWQAGEQRASEDIAAGRTSGPFKDADDMFRALDEVQ